MSHNKLFNSLFYFILLVITSFIITACGNFIPDKKNNSHHSGSSSNSENNQQQTPTQTQPISDNDRENDNTPQGSCNGKDYRKCNITIEQGYALAQQDLTGANFTHAYIPTSANLSGKNLTGANFDYATMFNVSLENATLVNASFVLAHMEQTNLTNANLTNANMNNVFLTNANLTSTIFNDANMYNASLVHAKGENVSFDGANLEKANFTSASLHGSFNKTTKNVTRLINAILVSADLSSSSFINANFAGATLAGASLKDSDLSGANLDKTSLIDTILENSTVSSSTTFDGAAMQGTNLIGVHGLNYINFQSINTIAIYTTTAEANYIHNNLGVNYEKINAVNSSDELCSNVGENFDKQDWHQRSFLSQYHDLTCARFAGANLSEAIFGSNSFANSVILVHADFRQVENLRGTIFSNTDLTRSKFSKVVLEDTLLDNTMLDYASFDKAVLDNITMNDSNLAHFNGYNITLIETRMNNTTTNNANFENSLFLRNNANYSDFNNSDLKGIHIVQAGFINSSFINADLSDATIIHGNFTGANLQRANLQNAKFFKSDLSSSVLRSTNIQYTNLDNANFSASNLFNTKLENISNTREVNFTLAQMSNVSFVNSKFNDKANFNFANLTHANLHNASFKGANFTGTNFTDADLSGADFTGAILIAVDFTRANLTNTNFTNAIMPSVDLSAQTGAILYNTTFIGANLAGANFHDIDFWQEKYVRSIGMTFPMLAQQMEDWAYGRINKCPFSGLCFIDSYIDDRIHVQGADLTNANLNGRNSILDLTDADIRGAIVTTDDWTYGTYKYDNITIDDHNKNILCLNETAYFQNKDFYADHSARHYDTSATYININDSMYYKGNVYQNNTIPDTYTISGRINGIAQQKKDTFDDIRKVMQGIKGATKMSSAGTEPAVPIIDGASDIVDSIFDNSEKEFTINADIDATAHPVIHNNFGLPNSRYIKAGNIQPLNMLKSTNVMIYFKNCTQTTSVITGTMAFVIPMKLNGSECLEEIGTGNLEQSLNSETNRVDTTYNQNKTINETLSIDNDNYCRITKSAIGEYTNVNKNGLHPLFLFGNKNTEEWRKNHQGWRFNATYNKSTYSN